MSTTQAKLDYASGTPPEWDAGAEAFELVETPRPGSSPKYELVGPCPRCGHTLAKDVTVYVGPALAATTSQDIVVRVVCNCLDGHPKTPEGTTGCGAEGGVRLEF